MGIQRIILVPSKLQPRVCSFLLSNSDNWRIIFHHFIQVRKCLFSIIWQESLPWFVIWECFSQVLKDRIFLLLGFIVRDSVKGSLIRRFILSCFSSLFPHFVSWNPKVRRFESVRGRQRLLSISLVASFCHISRNRPLIIPFVCSRVVYSEIADVCVDSGELSDVIKPFLF